MREKTKCVVGVKETKYWNKMEGEDKKEMIAFRIQWTFLIVM
jgi:hypothetical protein